MSPTRRWQKDINQAEAQGKMKDRDMTPPDDVLDLPLVDGFDAFDAEYNPELKRELELSIIATSYGPKSTRQQFTEPLSLTDQKFIEWLADRYEGKDGTPVMTFACDGVTTLLVPAGLRRKREITV